MAGSGPQLALTSQLVLLWVAFLEMATLCHFKDLLWAEGVVPSEGIFGLAEYPSCISGQRRNCSSEWEGEHLRCQQREAHGHHTSGS